MEEEIDFCKNHPTSGVVLGVLKKEGKIDLDATHRLSNRAHPLSVTFHKAIDQIPEPLEELEKLSDIENVIASSPREGLQPRWKEWKC